ncbi:hypothetical protein K2173_012219 [Erythroxylum novogranatense]|uniref:Molybdopterin biosynthesis protein CNX1 n=1 Tax=Erythroxylum novogranatense TaxID=1862640 RepID=A0AAV8T7G4_9ROSI|nr:hypothetical protein K2173_012219 [Erythroxylum novogranatense]
MKHTLGAMISADEALQIVLRVAQHLPPVALPLHDGLGKVLAEDILASDPSPPYPASIKGCDIKKGVIVLKCGERLGASEIGLLATCNYGEGA